MTGAGKPARRVGLDVGGANLKIAVAEVAGARPDGAAPRARLLSADTHPFPLWHRPDGLPDRLVELAREHPAGSVALTMTGELTDAYPDRRRGVEAILRAVREAWTGADLLVLCADGEWRRSGEVLARPLIAAAANWRATGALLGRRSGTVLLADMGSTTTDLVPVRDGRVGSGATTDLERLAAGELVYTGLLRTPVAAMLRELPPADGHPALPLAAERFAIAADVHLWLGHIEPDAYRAETPDGRAPTRAAAGRRLARMVCSDPEELGSSGIDRIAREAAEAQARRILGAIERQRLRGDLPRRACATGAGAPVLARILRRADLDVVEPPGEIGGPNAAASAAAAAALLRPPAAGEGTRGERAGRESA